jgi:5-methylthioadenosine/S-adenosylhomocysteine deaminase
MAVGTDEFRMDMITETRIAAVTGEVVDQDHLAVTAQDVFYDATFGGAKGLSRESLGRLARGAKADIVIIDLRDIHAGLTDHLVKTLVYMANYRDVEKVIIDGRVVVDDRRVLNVDEEKIVHGTRRVLEGLTRNLVVYGPVGPTARQMLPPLFPMV